MPDNEIRDQLADILYKQGAYCGNCDYESRCQECDRVLEGYAAAVLGAGFRPPARVITDAAELDALPLGSVCRTEILGGDVWWRVSDEGWEVPLSARAWSSAEIVGRGDVTVLWTPEGNVDA